MGIRRSAGHAGREEGWGTEELVVSQVGREGSRASFTWVIGKRVRKDTVKEI